MRSLVLLLTALAATASAQPLQIIAVSPAPNAVGIARSGPLAVTFDRPIDPATVTSASIRVMGRWSGVGQGTLSLHEDGRQVRFTPARPFAAGETVTLQMARTVAAADGTPLSGARGWSFWAAVTPGVPSFVVTDTVRVRRPGEGAIITYGGSAADFDGDGWSDLLVSNESANDVRLFLNDGAGGYGPFTVIPLVDGSVPSPVETGDFDGDGDVDVAVANIGNNRVSVLLNDGTGQFPDRTSYLAGQTVRGLAILDLDGDGLDDVVTANYTSRTVTVLRGQPGGTFGPPVALAQTFNGPHALAVADADGDGRLDLYLGNYQGQNVQTLLADDLGGLTPLATSASCGGPWQVAAGDLNGDGHADLAVSGSFCNVVTVHLADGVGGFQPRRQIETGSFVIAIDLGDLDGDGDLDVVTSNYASRDFRIHENLGDATFAPARVLAVAGAGSCALLHDRDNDGDLDITGVDEVDDLLYLYVNQSVVAGAPGPETAALALVLAGSNPVRDRTVLRVSLAAAVGARLVVYDALGRAVHTAFDGPLAAGRHDVHVDLQGLAPGPYLARLEAAGAAATVRLAVAR